MRFTAGCGKRSGFMKSVSPPEPRLLFTGNRPLARRPWLPLCSGKRGAFTGRTSSREMETITGRTETRPTLRNVKGMEYDISKFGPATATPALRGIIWEDYREWVRTHPNYPRKGKDGPPGFLGPKYGLSAKQGYHFSMLFKHARAEEYRTRFIAGESLDDLWCEYKESGAMRGEPRLESPDDEPKVPSSEEISPALPPVPPPVAPSNAWKPRTDPAYIAEFEALHKEAFKEYQKAMRPLANKCGGMINIHYQLCQRLSRGNGWWKIVLREEQSFTEE